MNGLQAQRLAFNERKRGVLLTQQGLQKFQIAKTEAEQRENNSLPYTQESLSFRIGIDPDTLRKVLAREDVVDKRTLCRCFKTFNLLLTPSDFCRPTDSLSAVPMTEEYRYKHQEIRGRVKFANSNEDWLEFPEGQVKLTSKFYVERHPTDEYSFQAILQPGALIRINAPRLMGKTSLMTRILYGAMQRGYRTVALNLQLADSKVWQDSNQFLRWLCINISKKLQLPNQVEQYWDESLGSKICCQDYFEHYLLGQLNHPLVLAFDEVNLLFQHVEIANDFLTLLRIWHEEAKNHPILQQLRHILVYSNEVYIPSKLHQTLGSMGLSIELEEFCLEQVNHLACCYGLNWESAQVKQLMRVLGGHPYLIQVALYHMRHQNLSIQEFLALAPTEAGPYHNYLHSLLSVLRQQPTLAIAYKMVLEAMGPVYLESFAAFELFRIGLIHFTGNEVTPRCELYQEYFRDRLNVLEERSDHPFLHQN